MERDREESVDLAQISLRPLQLSDVDDLMVWTTDEKVTKFCTWETYSSKDQGIDFIQNRACEFLWGRAICLNDHAIGFISMTSSSASDKSREKSVELGYVLGSKYWSRGIMTYVVKQVKKVAFREFPHLERLEALVDAENVGSQRVLEKAAAVERSIESIKMNEGVSSKEESKSIDLTRITLRETDLSDVEDHMVWSSDAKVTEFCTWGPYTSKEEAIDFINGIPNIFSWYRAICLDNQAIGSVSVCLQRDRYREKVAEVGYILASEYWGKGIVTHVLKQVVKIVFSMYPQVERLEALTDNENLASQRVLEKAGFQREGVLRNYVYVKGKSRDVAIYSFLPTDLHSEFASLKL
ncbi:hypothetical protein AHAS_Ahas15G0126600 [Arachis hypogaea]|uniref:N-acetyltransferase domain-containing protein n=1 Tax=Arachis hypogaea TaxID=3818 RepID=A0A444Z7L2_ARAHY|nr:hypothetical protein Ahy_B05g078649 isoform C [Arachis hypogaea]